MNFALWPLVLVLSFGSPLALAAGASFDSLAGDLRTKRVVASYQAEGSQIYECADGKWVFKGPVAALKDKSGKVVAIHHSASVNCAEPKADRPPTWESFDGSEIIGTKIAAQDVKGSIPSLVIALGHSNGVGSFATATDLIRTKTSGGAAPAPTECNGDTDGQRRAVPYKAEYVLYDQHTPAAATGAPASQGRPAAAPGDSGAAR